MNTAAAIATIISTLLAVAGIGVAVWQTRKAHAAELRSSELKQYLDKMRWQQLRSTSEQIDMLERDGMHELNVAYASIRGRLREQFASTLATAFTATHTVTPKVIRHWVANGRLTASWQIVDALSHLDTPPAADDEDFAWLQSKLGPKAPAVAVRTSQPPKELSSWACFYITLIADNQDLVLKVLQKESYHSGNLRCMLDLMARDQDMLIRKPFATHRSAWGSDGKTIAEIFAHYSSQDLNIMVMAGAEAKAKLDACGDGLFSDYEYLVPTKATVEKARARLAVARERAAALAAI